MDRELLHRYFKNETSKEEEQQIINWAEASPENHRNYLQERMVWDALLIHAPKAVANRREFGILHPSPFFWKSLSIAASLALLLTFSWFYTSTNDLSQSMQSVFVPAGQHVELQMEDGTRVWLNSMSKLTYPTSFGRQKREVMLDGEGYFEVTKNERAPFIVKTGKYDIKVLGTTFNVTAYKRKPGFETSLIEGSVQILSDKSEDIVTLAPLQKATDINGVLRKDTIHNTDYLRWREGLICLDDIPFDELMEKFSTYYDIHILIRDKKVLNYRCTGKFRLLDGIDYALKVLQKDIDFTYVRDDDSHTITIN